MVVKARLIGVIIFLRREALWEVTGDEKARDMGRGSQFNTDASA